MFQSACIYLHTACFWQVPLQRGGSFLLLLWPQRSPFSKYSLYIAFESHTVKERRNVVLRAGHEKLFSRVWNVSLLFLLTWVCVSAPLCVSSSSRTRTGTWLFPPAVTTTEWERKRLCFCMICILLEAFPYFLPFMNIHTLAPGKYQKVLFIIHL